VRLRSLRARLTVVIGALSALALVGFALVVYLLLSVQLMREIDTQLAERASLLAQDAALTEGSVRAPTLLEEFDVPGLYAVLVTPEGEAESTSTTLPREGIPIPPALLQAHLASGPGHATLTVGEDDQLRLFLLPLESATRARLLVVAESLEPLERTLARSQVVLASSGAVFLIVIVLSAALLTQRALLPLRQVTAKAETIARKGSYSERLPLPSQEDEVYHLARTVNDLIATVQITLQTQRQFLADTSHELRSPLTVLLANLNLLRRASLAPDERALCVEEALAESEGMRRLVNDLLLLAQEDSAQVVSLQPVHLNSIVEKLVMTVARQATHHQFHLRMEGACYTLGDQERLTQLLRNLLDNAIFHTPEGSRIEVCLALQGDLLRLSVSDDGPGIPPEHLPHLWDRFYRVDPARSRAFGGSGLGLAIVQYLARAHGGAVHVTSEVGRGATFLVTLPALAPASSMAAFR
jgi:two-component system, OmpR family, sensor kinase